MKITYPGYTRIKKEKRELWKRIAFEFNAGVPVDDIRNKKKFFNKKTGKPYDRTHIYYMLRKLRDTK